jgi:hypothetical protein
MPLKEVGKDHEFIGKTMQLDGTDRPAAKELLAVQCLEENGTAEMPLLIQSLTRGIPTRPTR